MFPFVSAVSVVRKGGPDLANSFLRGGIHRRRRPLPSTTERLETNGNSKEFFVVAPAGDQPPPNHNSGKTKIHEVKSQKKKK